MQQINQNYFQLFDLSESFDLDLGKLSEKYHARQVEVHPDKFSGTTEKDKLRAVQLTSYLNEAYSTLKAPIKRAAYLLTIKRFHFAFNLFKRIKIHGCILFFI